MIAITIFIIALLLATEALEPTGAWLVTVTALAGVETFRPRRWMRVGRLLRWPFASGIPGIPLAIFVIALLLTIGRIESIPPWLVTLAVLSGIHAFLPWRGGRRRHRARRRSDWVDDPWLERESW